MSLSIVLQVRTDSADAEELSELVADLQQTLIDAGIDSSSIERQASHHRAKMSIERTFDPALLNIMLLSLASTKVLRSIIKVIETWITSRNCSVRIRSGNQEFEFDGRPVDLNKLAQFLSTTGTEDELTPPDPPAES